MIRGTIVIGGEEITAGIDLDDAKETGAIEKALVVKFDSMEDMGKAQRGEAVTLRWVWD